MASQNLDVLFAEFIEKHKVGLCQNTKITVEILYTFLSNRIITEEEHRAITEEKTPYRKSNEFYLRLKTKVKHLPQLPAHFRNAGQQVPANILDTFLKDNKKTFDLLKSVQTPSGQNTGTGSQTIKNADEAPSAPTPLKLLSAETDKKVVAGAGDGSKVSADSSLVQSHLTDFTAKDGFDMLEDCEREIKSEYPRKTNGVAFIINQVNFGRRPKLFRQGAEKDQSDVNNVLTELGFKVFGVQDYSYTELIEAIKQLQILLKEEEADCLVVVVMSHGNEANDFMTSDEGWISSWSEVVEKFNNDNCPVLAGKPKIFLFQFCRGDTVDSGTQRDSIDDGLWDESKIPSWTDMLVCYSTLDGHYAYREKEGAWFMQLICEVFRRRGRDHDICELLNLVSEMMKCRRGRDRRNTELKQICPYYNIGFTKKFYLADR